MPIHQKLISLGIDLPTPSQTIAHYLPYIRVDNMIVISGQLPLADGKVVFLGKVGKDISQEEGQAAARLCAINILAHLKVACGGDLNPVKQCVRLGGFVNCLPSYTDQPKILNAASDLMVDVFGESGRHARSAIGVSALPLGAAVEIEATFLVG